MQGAEQRATDSGYLEKGIQTPMAQGRSTKIIPTIKWIRTRRLSIKNSLSLQTANLEHGNPPLPVDNIELLGIMGYLAHKKRSPP